MVGSEEREVKELFYKLYPKSDPKYFKHFRFVRIPHFKGGVSLEVYYKVSEESSFLITKGKNDKDPRWKAYLYGFNFPQIWRKVAQTVVVTHTHAHIAINYHISYTTLEYM